MREGVYHLIMAGGSGTRFWPASRSGRPKQFLALAGDLPLLRQAFDRAAALSGASRVFVASGEAQRRLVMEALPELEPGRFVGEPVGRNTAPCVGLAALRLERIDRGGVMVVSPADHVYTKPQELARALEIGVETARAGEALVTLGIRPTRPDTGYGYIEVEEAEAADLPTGVRRAVRFVEKPDGPTARRYLESGRFLWNSGVFVWRTAAILEAIESCAPALWRGLRRIRAALGGAGEDATIGEVFAALESISIDYAVMEKAPRVLVVPSDPGWSDVGSWDAAADLHAADAAGNVLAPGSGEPLLINSQDCFVWPAGGRLLALVGVSDLLVVDAGDALLVCRRGDSQSVRAVVEALKARGRGDLL